MRDSLIEQIYRRMGENSRIFFLSADFGAPALDKLRQDFADRFINVGIAEQNLINVSTGLALEGFIIYAYAISAFLTMRTYEQIRNNLALMSQHKELNVNLIGVGAGASYDMSGPSHHCFEDLSIIRTLPNILLCSPSDWVVAKSFVDFSININKPKYIRLDGKNLPQIYDETDKISWNAGFCELKKGDKICIVSTGYATHKAIKLTNQLSRKGVRIGIVDVFMLKELNKNTLLDVLKKYKAVFTIEEAFINKGGLDSLIYSLLASQTKIKFKSFGFDDKYIFISGKRDFLAETTNFSESAILKAIMEFEQQ
jgi:transketolase